MEHFSFSLLNILAKCFIIDTRLGSKYAFEVDNIGTRTTSPKYFWSCKYALNCSCVKTNFGTSDFQFGYFICTFFVPDVEMDNSYLCSFGDKTYKKIKSLWRVSIKPARAQIKKIAFKITLRML